MKKKLLLAGAALLLAAAAVTGYSAYSKTNVSDLLNANVEALARGESDYHGRWRTVGCGGAGFDHWKTYCCPHDYYDNCPGPGDCTENPIGC